MKTLLFILLGCVLCACGCVNQNIAARRGNIPWNRPTNSDMMPGVPQSIIEQYD